MIKKLLFTAVLIIAFSQNFAQNVNIPSASFKAYLVGNTSINTNNDGEIQVSEAQAFTGTINCANQNMGDLTGIEAFTSLTGLVCWSSFLTSLDLSNNLALTTLNCQNNAISSLDLSANTALSSIAVGLNTPLNYLNIANGNNANLSLLAVASTPNLSCIQIDDADTSSYNWTGPSFEFDAGVSFSNNCGPAVVNIPDANFKAYLVGNSAINTNNDSEIQVSEANNFNAFIACASLNISDLTGIEEFINLKGLVCSYNNISSVDLSANTALQTFEAINNQLSSLDISNNTALINLIIVGNQISSLDLSQNVNLQSLVCYNNNLSSLDISNNPNIGQFNCNNNQISSLNLGSSTSLFNLYFAQNPISSIDLSTVPNLVNIAFNETNITSIDLSMLSNLSSVFCHDLQMPSLDLSQNSNLTSLYAHNGILSSLNLANGNNENLDYLWIHNNPNLDCILVDSTEYSTNNWINGILANEDPYIFDAQHSFNKDCTATGISELHASNFSSVYPNPVKDFIRVESNKALAVQIVDLFGSVYQELELTAGFNQVYLELLPSGLYFLISAEGDRYKLVKN
ncbi:MAG: T9SS type A sorting domain-containing protein [Chitinophagales bacterium]